MEFAMENRHADIADFLLQAMGWWRWEVVRVGLEGWGCGALAFWTSTTIGGILGGLCG